MRSLVMVLIEHGGDTDELTEFCSNIREDMRFAYTGLEVEDWSVKVDVPQCFVLGVGEKITT